MALLSLFVLSFLTVLFTISSTTALEEPPRIASIQYGYNVLLGKTPNEQRNELIGGPIFKLTGSASDSVGRYTKYDQISDMSNLEFCSWEGVSHKVSYAQSSETLESQSSSSSNGYDQQSSLGVSAPLGGAEVSTETTVRNALIFGNSRTSTKEWNERNDGYEYTFDATASRNLYAVEVGYDFFEAGDYDDIFRNGCSSLGSTPLTADIVGFFQKFGTHGLRTASFGQTCTSSVFMEGGSSRRSYISFNRGVASNDASMLWWSSTSSSEETDSESTSSEYGFDYQYGNRHCLGEMKTSSACGENMIGNGEQDTPAVIKWTYKPIWEMNVPELSSTAKLKMKEVFQDFMTAAAQCVTSYCSSRGACAPRVDMWRLTDTAREASGSLIQFFSSDRCFCDDVRIGRSCDTGRPVSIASNAVFPTSYHNDFDEEYTVVGRSDSHYAPFCGMESYHENKHEDRRFKWAVCGVEEDPYRIATLWTSLDWTKFDEGWTRTCPEDAFIAWVRSKHENKHEDREYHFQCAHFHNAEHDSCVWDDDWRNSFDENLNYFCPQGYAMAGIESYHENKHEDRRFKFKCCSMKVKLSA